MYRKPEGVGLNEFLAKGFCRFASGGADKPLTQWVTHQTSSPNPTDSGETLVSTRRFFADRGLLSFNEKVSRLAAEFSFSLTGFLSLLRDNPDGVYFPTSESTDTSDLTPIELSRVK